MSENVWHGTYGKARGCRCSPSTPGTVRVGFEEWEQVQCQTWTSTLLLHCSSLTHSLTYLTLLAYRSSRVRPQPVGLTSEICCVIQALSIAKLMWFKKLKWSYNGCKLLTFRAIWTALLTLQSLKSLRFSVHWHADTPPDHNGLLAPELGLTGVSWSKRKKCLCFLCLFHFWTELKNLN